MPHLTAQTKTTRLSKDFNDGRGEIHYIFSICAGAGVNGGVKSANFDDDKVIRMNQVPEIQVHIVKSSEKIAGIGG